MTGVQTCALPIYREQGANGDASTIIIVGYVTREEHRTDEGDDFSQADGTQGQRSSLGAIMFSEFKDLPGNGHALDLDRDCPEHNRRQVKAERA